MTESQIPDPTPATRPPRSPSDAKWRAIALISLPLVGILLVLLAIAIVTPRDNFIVVHDNQGAAANPDAINRGNIIDATDPAVDATPRLGYRYRVFVEDESEDRSSGIAKIAGRTTFISGARRGQTAIVDVTRVRPNVVDAVLVRVVSTTVLPPKAPRAPYTPPADDPAATVVQDAEFDVVVAENSDKHPDRECIARIAGLIVVIDQPLPPGERVNIRITERRERIAFATPTGKPAGQVELAPAAAPRKSGRGASRGNEPASAPDKVLPGEEYEVTIIAPSSKNPDTESVAKIDGLVVFVRNPPPPGETCRVRIVERRARNAVAEVVAPAEPAAQ